MIYVVIVLIRSVPTQRAERVVLSHCQIISIQSVAIAVSSWKENILWDLQATKK